MNASKSYLYANTWGYNQNGSWNGMTGYLARGEVEIGGSPMFFTSQRSSVVEYISSPTPTRSKFVFLQPKLSYENNLFLLSFQKYLWYGAMLLVILLFLFLFLITHWEWKKMGSCDEQGLFAFHMETGVGYKFVGKYFEEGEKCGLKEIQYLQVIDPWLAVRKGSVFIEIFKIGTKRLQEHGLQQRQNRLLYMKRPKCSGKQSNFVSVSMVDCYFAFLVLLYGAIVSTAIMAIEVLYKKRNDLLFKCT
ncbi:unnamed protein product [Leptidea sinapis]|uniref:Ionotropic glutamate receptor C-terminal domain-containing protein n=1 Tax=Leptidea sinapis TaxID=189913 RepID=A0A5E4PMG5_9NEOP|nr:unnamed protein product [Leptidea sinapis]